MGAKGFLLASAAMIILVMVTAGIAFADASPSPSASPEPRPAPSYSQQPSASPVAAPASPPVFVPRPVVSSPSPNASPAPNTGNGAPLAVLPSSGRALNSVKRADNGNTGSPVPLTASENQHGPVNIGYSRVNAIFPPAPAKPLAASGPFRELPRSNSSPVTSTGANPTPFDSKPYNESGNTVTFIPFSYDCTGPSLPQSLNTANGSITFKQSNMPWQVSGAADYCNDSKSVYKYVCVGGRAGKALLSCLNGCSNNACNPAPINLGGKLCGGQLKTAALKKTASYGLTGLTELASQHTPNTAALPKQKELPASIKQGLANNSVEGYLETLIIDKVPANSTRKTGIEYYINTGKNRYPAVLTTNSGLKGISGERVKATAITPENYIAVEKATNAAPMDAGPKTSAPNPNIGVQHVAVIITKPVGGQNPNTADLQLAMWKVNDYYKKTSMGLASITWDVYGPYEFANAPDSVAPDYYLPVALNDVGDYHKYSFVLSIDERNGTDAGLGRGPVNINNGVNLGVAFVPPESTYVEDWETSIIFELGHGFGATHSNFLDCRPNPVDTPDKCYAMMYGDWFDVLGNSALHSVLPPFNSIQKENIGWLDGKAITATNAGEYTIYPYETAQSAGVLKVPMKVAAGSDPAYYYIEYRTWSGLTYNGTQNNSGPQIRARENAIGISNLYDPNQALAPQYDSMLIARDPVKYYVPTPFIDNSVPYRAGQSFTGLDGTVISVKSVSPDKAVIDVSC